MSRDINPFGLRMPAELRASIERASKASGRSLNTEIVHRLQESLEAETPYGQAVQQFSQEWDVVEQTLRQYASDVRFAISARAYQRIKATKKPTDVDLERLSAIVEKYGDPPQPLGMDPDVYMSEDQRRRIMRQVKEDVLTEGKRQLEEKARPKKK